MAEARRLPLAETEETTYSVYLKESDVEALKAGIVTPYLQKYAIRLLAWKDDETHPMYRAYGREKSA
jgi:hypothetical protein